MGRKGTGYFAIGTLKAGAIAFKTKYWVPGEPGRRSKRKEQEAAKKEKQNEYAAIKALTALISLNFGKGDVLLGLDYSETAHKKLDRAAGVDEGLNGDALETARVERQNEIRLAAKHELVLCLRRVKRVLDKDGIPLLAASVTSDMDGDTGEHVRVHHHLIVPADTVQAFREKWEDLGMGGVSWTPLWEDQVDRTPLAEYLIRQVRRIPNEDKFGTTRNLCRPQKKTPRACTSDAELRVPKGCTLLFRQAYKPGQAQHIRYLLPPEQIAAAEEERKRRRKRLYRPPEGSAAT